MESSGNKLESVDRLAEEFMQRRRRGERPTIEQRMGFLVGGVFSWADVSLSPGKRENRALVTVSSDDEQSTAIWLHELQSGRVDQVTYPPKGSADVFAVWLPDGEHFVFRRELAGDGVKIMQGRADGAGDSVELGTGGVTSVSSDGKHLLYEMRNLSEYRTDWDIGYIPLEGDSQPQVLRDTTADERDGRISPDGHLVAYSSGVSGDREVYLTRFPSGEGRQPVSTRGGIRPFWGRHAANQTLYYLDPEGWILYRVSVKYGADDERLNVSIPEPLIDYREVGIPPYTRLDTSQDGKRFIAVQLTDFDRANDSSAAEDKLILVENWLGQFKNQDGGKTP